MKLKFSGFIACALIFSCMIGTSMAGLSVTGTSIRADVAPGDHFVGKSIVGIDKTDKPTDFLVNVTGYGQTDNGGKENLGLSDQTSFMAPFLKPNPEKFHLEPGTEQAITVEGDVPSDIGDGGKYALMHIMTKPIESSSNGSGGAIAVVLAINVPIELTIKGSDIKKAGEISNLSLLNPASAKYQNFTAILKNTGNYLYKIQSKAELKDSSGTVITNVTNPVDQIALIPPNSRRLNFKLAPTSALAPGKYSLTATVSLEDGTVLATKDTSIEIKG